MSKTPPENPTAFPLVLPDGFEEYRLGMSLRDYFAGQAIIGLIVRSDKDAMVDVPELAYAFADQMLKARAE